MSDISYSEAPAKSVQGSPRPPRGRTELNIWLFLRISGVLLIVLALFHMFWLHFVINVEDVTFNTIVQRWNDPTQPLLSLFWRLYRPVFAGVCFHPWRAGSQLYGQGLHPPGAIQAGNPGRARWALGHFDADGPGHHFLFQRLNFLRRVNDHGILHQNQAINPEQDKRNPIGRNTPYRLSRKIACSMLCWRSRGIRMAH